MNVKGGYTHKPFCVTILLMVMFKFLELVVAIITCVSLKVVCVCFGLVVEASEE